MEKRLLLPLIFLCALIMPNGVLHGAEENFTPEKIATECEMLKPDAIQPYLNKIIEHINKEHIESCFARSNLCSKILEQLVVSKTENGKSAFKALYKLMQEKVVFVGEDLERKELLVKIWPKLPNNEELKKYIFIGTLNKLQDGWIKDRLVEGWWDELPEKYRSDIFATYFEQKEFAREVTLKKYAANLSPDVLDRFFSQLWVNKSNFMQRELLSTFWDYLPKNRRFTLVTKFYTENYIVKKASLPEEQEALLPSCPSLAELIKAETKHAEPSFFDSYLTRTLCAFASVVSGFFVGGLWDSIRHTACFKKYPTCTALGCGTVGLACVFAGHYGARRFTQNSVRTAKKPYNKNQKQSKIK